MVLIVYVLGGVCVGVTLTLFLLNETYSWTFQENERLRREVERLKFLLDLNRDAD